ncbi:MAG: hypothetical protein PVJ11_10155 [Syntrophobacterales bacterium]|jgi:hypothetical protein
MTDQSEASSDPKTPQGAGLTIFFCLALGSLDMRQGLPDVK